MINNILGMGIDVHLLGLKQVARENAIPCPIFEDDSFRVANHFALSTSQVIFFFFFFYVFLLIDLVLLINLTILVR